MKVRLTILLRPLEVAWLDTAAAEHDLPSTGKALRCCINFACQASEGATLLAGEASTDTVEVELLVAQTQLAWLASVAARGGPSGDAAASPAEVAARTVRACIRRCPDARASAEIFAVIRCKSATGAEGCAGAAAAKLKAAAAEATTARAGVAASTAAAPCACAADDAASTAAPPSPQRLDRSALERLFGARDANGAPLPSAVEAADAAAVDALLPLLRPLLLGDAPLPSATGLRAQLWGAPACAAAATAAVAATRTDGKARRVPFWKAEAERKQNPAVQLPQRVARGDATDAECTFWRACERTSLFQVYTQEFVVRLVGLLAARAVAAGLEREGDVDGAQRAHTGSVLTVLEVGAGDGRLSAALLREAKRREAAAGLTSPASSAAGAAAEADAADAATEAAETAACTATLPSGEGRTVRLCFRASDSGRDRIRCAEDAALPRVARLTSSRALASFAPSRAAVGGGGDVTSASSPCSIVVLCAWMPQGVDWTQAWRADRRVAAYVLVGPADAPTCGDLYATWGRVPSDEFAHEYGIDLDAPPPFAKDGFEREDVPMRVAGSSALLCRFDHAAMGEASISRVVAFVRRR